MTLTLNSDNTANFSLNGTTGETTDWWIQTTFPIDTSGFPCGQDLELIIDATNDGGQGGLIFELTSEDCNVGCEGTGCSCNPCSYYMPGCAECTATNLCQACKRDDYRASLTPVTSPDGDTCPCADMFYQDANGVCVRCPPEKFCRTCELVST